MHVEFESVPGRRIVRAVRQGVSPDGGTITLHSIYVYQGMSDQDVVDLWSFWQTLPSSEQKSQAHHLPFMRMAPWAFGK